MTGLSPLKPLMVVFLLCGILMLGFGLRILNLGGPSFGIDEILHIYAAQAIIGGNPPTLPSGYPYNRGRLYTTTVALSGSVFGLNEWSARLPSVLFGCLTIWLVFLIGRQWYSNGAGLIAAFVTAVAPMQIVLSRQARMYAMFQLFYLLFVYFFFSALESSPRAEQSRPRPNNFQNWFKKFKVNPFLFIAAGVALILAIDLHRLTFVSLSGPVAYVIGTAILAVFIGTMTKLLIWKYLIVALLTTSLIVLGNTVFTELVGHFVALAHFAPEWARHNAYNWRYYYQMFLSSYPLIFETLVLAAVFALIRNTKATVYILACFAVPVFIHSYLLAWKNSRYIFHIVPLMFIIFSVGASSVLYHLYRTLSSWAGTVLQRTPAQVTAATLTTIAVAFLLAFMPWIRGGITAYQKTGGYYAGALHSNWHKSMQIINARAQPSDIIITSVPLLAKYYGPDAPLYYIGNNNLELLLSEGFYDAQRRPLEYTSGAPIIINLKMLQEVVSAHPSGWIVTERFHFYGSRPLPPDLIKFISENFQLENVFGADDMIVWRWSRAA